MTKWIGKVSEVHIANLILIGLFLVRFKNKLPCTVYIEIYNVLIYNT